MVSYFAVSSTAIGGNGSALAPSCSATLILYLVYNRLIGIDKMKLG
jgi:hypothetical protein